EQMIVIPQPIHIDLFAGTSRRNSRSGFRNADVSEIPSIVVMVVLANARVTSGSSAIRKLYSDTICPAKVSGPPSASETGFFVLLPLNLLRGEKDCPARPVPDPEGCGDLTQALALCL